MAHMIDSGRYDFFAVYLTQIPKEDSRSNNKVVVHLKKMIMKRKNWDPEKDLNANPESKLNTNRPVTKPDRFPESRQAKDEQEKLRHKKPDSGIEQLSDDVAGAVGERETGSNPSDIAGVSDIDRGMRRSRRKY